MINEFKYGQTWKIWPSPLSLSLYSTFTMLTEEFDKITWDKNNIDPDLVHMDSFWEKVEVAVIFKTSTHRNLESLNIKPNFYY